MSAPPLRGQIATRAGLAGISLRDEELDKLIDYYALLERWNQKINLTALALAARADSTIDRLIVEPLVAAVEFQPGAALSWMDFGSGGGSPAIPLKLVRTSAHLTMVEARERKSAFLREAVGNLGLRDARVETARIEDLAGRLAGSMDIVTVRAVRASSELFGQAACVLRPGGKLLVFRGESPLPDVGATFVVRGERPLDPSAGFLTTLERTS